MTKQVTYKKFFAIFITLCSIFILWSTTITGASINTVTGIILLPMGILYLTNSAIEYTDDELKIKNLYGMVMATHSFKTDKIEVRDRVIYANDKKIRLGFGILNSTEYRELLDFIEGKI